MDILLVILTVKKLLERLMNTNCKRQIKQGLELKNYSREKVINFILSGKVMIIHLLAGLMKKISLYKMSYFPEPYTHSKSKTIVELDLSNMQQKLTAENFA